MAAEMVSDRRLLTAAQACSYLRRLAPDLLLDDREFASQVRLGFGPDALQVGTLHVYHPLDLLCWSERLRMRQRSSLS